MRESLFTLVLAGCSAGSEAFAVLTMRSKGAIAPAKKGMAQLIEIGPDTTESDYWKLIPALDILRDGGVGIIPTDTCYAFACDVHSRKGVERIFQLKNVQRQRKPLSLLCKDISTISTYTSSVDKRIFRMLKDTLPGPYTYILPATHEVPRVFLEHKHHKRTWKRREVGVRMPNDPVCLEMLRSLDSPLLCSSVPLRSEGGGEAEGDASSSWDADSAAGLGTSDSDEPSWSSSGRLASDPTLMYERWAHAVDFVVDRGPIGGEGLLSTVVDLMGPEPVILRAGAGDTRLVLGS